jgi:hypothetical protein
MLEYARIFLNERTRALSDMTGGRVCPSVAVTTLHGLWHYNVWSGKKFFFTHARQGQQSLTAFCAKCLNYANLGFCTISMHVMLGSCVPNLRGRGWVEHTQMHLKLKKGTKNSIILAILEEFLVNSLFQKTRIPMADIKVLVYSNFSKKIEKNWNLQAPGGMEDFTLPNVGARFKKQKRKLYKGFSHLSYLFLLPPFWVDVVNSCWLA